MKLYKTLVWPVLMYGCETWKMNKSDERILDVFQNKCLRRIHNIRWQDHITTEEVLAKAEMSPVSKEVKKRRWKFIGHTLRQDRTSDARTALSWRPEGKRKRGRPKTTWRRTVEREMREGGWGSWDEVRSVAVDREKWKASVKALCATGHAEDR